MLESVSSESESSANDASAAQRQQKHAVLSQALLELHSFPSLLQCYNAAYYFVTASTAPRPVVPVGTAVGSDSNSVMSAAVDPATNQVEMAITPAVLEGLDCCEQLCSTLAHVLAVTAAAHPTQLREANLVDVTLFLQLLQPLLDLVSHTTPVIDSTAKGKTYLNIKMQDFSEVPISHMCCFFLFIQTGRLLITWSKA